METTKVFNTKAGTKYDDYGAYSATAGTYTSQKSDESYTATVTTDIDYANTTVAFAVVWTPALVEDTVVVDYGLDVVIDVYKNDGLAAGVTGVMSTAPDANINSGTYSTAVGKASITGTDGLWTASKESLTSVRFKQNEMGMKEPAKFYYEAGVNYYTYDSSNNATLNTTNMYSSVTVIPATIIYYEDNFVDFTSFTKDADTSTYIEDTTTKWYTAGIQNTSITQDQDRPGESKISETLDADNNYGYDSAYTSSSLYSLGSAEAIDVTSDIRGEATFSFYGTGFDIIGLTSNTTGTLIVQVYNASGNAVKTSVVDTYYGYAYDKETQEWITVDSTSSNALYQVPVMKLYDLDYGKYTVKLTAGYNTTFDHTSDENGDYTLYIDAIRIFDPANDGASDDVIKNAYIADGEAYPEYTELRDEIITAETFNALGETDSTIGIVFIDGAATDPDGEVTIADYTEYGPNNEVYLQFGQAVAFDLNATASDGEVASVQLAIKSVGGIGTVEVYGIDDSGNRTECLEESISTATDMYYDITKLNGMTVVIKNAGESDEATISLTNIKTTYTAEQPVEDDETAAIGYNLLSVSRTSASYALMSLSMDDATDDVEPDIPTEEPEEETKPEIFIPETFEVSLDKTEVKVNKKVKVTVTTSEEVEYITVNGEVIEDCRTNKKTGLKTWSVRLTPTEAGEFPIEVVAYNEEGTASESLTETVTVTGKNNKGKGGR